ncbi:trypanothione synthetase [Perkinsela sp. CCAP 1560/4]|nr:trypanothione synthetase [Perkinsela sp. CCAP 1560/4]|eukprot:KNH08268.1 trypanothione synthetase [Perkinsela sp. CCAP 1560/4]
MKRVCIPAISAPLPFLNTMVPSEKYFSSVYGVDCTRKAENTGVYYAFDAELEKEIRRVTCEIHAEFLRATEKIIQSDAALEACGIDRLFWEIIRKSWKTQGNQSISGRLDFLLDNTNTIKLLEYNADSAGGILETAVIQRKWARSMHLKKGEDAGQKLELALINRWKSMEIARDEVMHFMIDNEDEEKYNAAYMQEVASAAGFKSKLCIGLDDFVWSDEKIHHVDGEPVKYVWKMWSWDTVLKSRLTNPGKGPIKNNTRPKLHDILLHPDILVLEPLWKVVTSNKMALVHLDPKDTSNILKVSTERPESWKYFQKPVNGHGGSSVAMYEPGKKLIVQRGGSFADSKLIFQEAAAISPLDGCYSTIGSWIVGNEFAGFGVREDTNQIISQDSPFRAARVVKNSSENGSAAEPATP